MFGSVRLQPSNSNLISETAKRARLGTNVSDWLTSHAENFVASVLHDTAVWCSQLIQPSQSTPLDPRIASQKGIQQYGANFNQLQGS